MRLPSRLGIGCASGARIRPFRAVIIHARELTARGFTLEMGELANRNSGAIQPAGDVALGRRRMRGVSRLPAISWWAGGYRPARLLTPNPPRRTAMPEDQPPDAPDSAAQAAVTRPAGWSSGRWGRATPARCWRSTRPGWTPAWPASRPRRPAGRPSTRRSSPGTGSSPPLATGRCWAGWPFPRFRPGGCMAGSSSTASTSVPVITAAGSARRSIGTVPASSASHARSGHVNRARTSGLPRSATASWCRSIKISASFHHDSRRDHPSSDTARETIRKISFKPTSRRSSHPVSSLPAAGHGMKPARAPQGICPGGIGFRHPHHRLGPFHGRFVHVRHISVPGRWCPGAGAPPAGHVDSQKNPRLRAMPRAS
jgi:hypothetical protein